MKRFFICFLSSFVLVLTGCSKKSSDIPKVVQENFDIYKFSGSWSEVYSSAGLPLGSINFAIDGSSIRVVRSYEVDGVSKKDEYKARFSGESSVGALEISKVGLVYEPFNIARVDNYQYALIYQKDSFLMISRNKTIPEVIKVIYLEEAKKDGYK